MHVCDARLGALLVHMIRIGPALARLGEALAARAAAAPLLVVELLALVGRAALALVQL